MQFTKATTFFALAALFASAIAAPAPSLPSVKELEIENVKPALNNGDINRSTQETDVIAKDNTVSDSSKNVGQCSGDRVLACCNDSNWNPAAKGAFTALNGLGQGVLKCTQIPTSVPVGVLGGAVSVQDNNQNTCTADVHCCSGDRDTNTGLIVVNGKVQCNKLSVI